MLLIHFLKRCIPASLLLLLTTGCVHDAYYVSAKDRRYDVVPRFMNSKITADSWVDETDQTSARYTSSHQVAQERYKSSVIGRLYLKDSENPAEESTVFSIRKENRAYTAETPVFGSFSIGKKEITPNFTIGHHRDHKVMAGLMFRMPF
jgi:hypothetical protein